MPRVHDSGPLVAAALLVVVSLALFAAPGARAGYDRVADLFASGAWEQARGQAAAAGAGARPAESLLWRSRLATATTDALGFLGEGLAQKRLDRPVRVRLALETAELELGRNHPAEALAAVSPLLDERDELPGQVQITAARALMALGRGPRARELLASVRSNDPAYALSRALLGDIAIGQGDGVQALRWYDAADQADTELRRRTVSGRCRALLLGGRRTEVEAVASQLESLDPGSLALAEIRRALRDHQDVEVTRVPASSQPAAATTHARGTVRDETREAPAERETAAAAPAAATGRFTLQLGAFSDRGRALEFQQKHAERVAGLTIEEGVDARGQSVYRLRAGSWPSPAEAEAAAAELGDRLGLDVIVVDREAAAGPDR
jgi:tetratricopeptide (TPR) repeat protein